MDRFKYRVWSEEDCGYMESIDIFRLTHSGKLVFNNESLNREPECNPKRYICEQCTGLKDKNGKLIYEGDIVDFDDSETYASIEWSEDDGCWRIITCENSIYTFDNLYGYELTICGNIHENADLLGE